MPKLLSPPPAAVTEAAITREATTMRNSHTATGEEPPLATARENLRAAVKTQPPVATARETACSDKDPAQLKIKEKILSSLVPPQSGSPDHYSLKTSIGVS